MNTLAEPKPRILATPEQQAKQFGCSPDVIRAKLRSNADWCDTMAVKAERLGKKVRGASAAEWRAIAANARKNASQ